MELETAPLAPLPDGLLLRLSPDHTAFEVELPSGSSVRVAPEALAGTLKRLLVAQKAARLAEDDQREAEAAQGRQAAMLAHWQRFGVGSAPSPTQQQLWHDERHGETPVDTCPFCRAEGHSGAKPRRAGGLTKRDLGGGISLRIAKRELSLEDLV